MTRFPRPDYRALSRYLPDRRPVPVDLSDNTNLWGTHPGALEVIREAGPELLARYPDLYADGLRAAVSRRFGLSEANVCTGCGSDDILDAAFRAASSPGGSVRWAAPTFSMLEPFCLMNGRKADPVGWAEALDDPALLLHGDPVVVYVCRPNNPTGHLAPRAWMDRLLGLVEARGAEAPLLVVDEAYADFAGESLVGEAPNLHRTLVVRTLSKAFGLAGLRVGWAAGSTEVIDEVEKARGPYKVGRLAGAGAVAAVEDAEGWVERTVADCLECRGRLLEALEARGLGPLPSGANFLLVPVPAGSATDKALALRQAGVAVRPFPASPGMGDLGDGLRITVGPWPLMERFLEALDELRAADPGAWRGASRPTWIPGDPT